MPGTCAGQGAGDPPPGPEVELTDAVRGQLLDPALWREGLERYARATGLAVALTDAAGRRIGACLNPRPTWGRLHAQAQASAPAGVCPFALVPLPACACVSDAVATGSVAWARDRAGLVHFAVPLVLGDHRLGALVAGQVFDQYPEQLVLEHVAKLSNVAPQGVWQLARLEHPVKGATLRVYADLLATLADDRLRSRYHTIREASRMAELEHRRAEAEEARQRYLDLVQGLDSVVWEADAATGRFTFMSRRVEDFFGYPAERWLAEPGFWLDRVHPEDRNYAAAVWKHAVSDGRGFELEYRAVAADSRTLWIREAVRSTREGQAQGLGLRGLMWNITKRKKIERQLYQAKSELAGQLSDMNHLYRLSTELLSVSGLGPTLKEVLAAVMGIQGAEMGLLRLHDRERDEMTVMTQVGLPKAYLEQFASMSVPLMACGQSIAPGEMVLVEDVDAEPSYVPCREAAKLGGYRAEVTLPLVRGDGEPLGTITTFFLNPHRPPDRQIRLVQMYAPLATAFIEAARLRDEVVMGSR